MDQTKCQLQKKIICNLSDFDNLVDYRVKTALYTGAVVYTDCTSAEE